jgi:hypothetical protein
MKNEKAFTSVKWRRYNLMWSLLFASLEASKPMEKTGILSPMLFAHVSVCNKKE